MTKQKNTSIEAIESTNEASGPALVAEAIGLAQEAKTLSDFQRASWALTRAAIAHASGAEGIELNKAAGAFFGRAEADASAQSRGFTTALGGKTDVVPRDATCSIPACIENTKPANAAIGKIERLAAEAKGPGDIELLGAAIWEFTAGYLTLAVAWKREFIQRRMDSITGAKNNWAADREAKRCRGCAALRDDGKRQHGCGNGADIFDCAKGLLTGAANRVRGGAEEAAAEAQRKAIEAAETQRESELRADVDFCRFADFLEFIERYIEAPAKSQRAMLLEWWKENGPQAAKITQ